MKNYMHYTKHKQKNILCAMSYSSSEPKSKKLNSIYSSFFALNLKSSSLLKIATTLCACVKISRIYYYTTKKDVKMQKQKKVSNQTLMEPNQE